MIQTTLRKWKSKCPTTSQLTQLRRWSALVIRKFGSSASGEVYQAYDIVTKSTVADKMDCVPGPMDLLEADMLSKLDGVKGVPWFLVGSVHSAKTYIAMDLLGKDLYDISENELSEKDKLLIAYVSFNILQGIQEKEIVHQDLKPENFAMGRHKNKNDLFILDFGLTKTYLKGQTGKFEYFFKVT